MGLGGPFQPALALINVYPEFHRADGHTLRLHMDQGAQAYQPQRHANFEQWAGENFPRLIAVSFQHPTPFFDDSYAVNSANNGPYGDAIRQELIPYIEGHFRIIREPWARVLTGVTLRR